MEYQDVPIKNRCGNSLHAMYQRHDHINVNC